MPRSRRTRNSGRRPRPAWVTTERRTIEASNPTTPCSPVETTIMNLTPRQLDVIVAIRNYRHLHGYSPTMQELADQLGTSKVTIFEHVGALEKKRVLRRGKHKHPPFEIMSGGQPPPQPRSTTSPPLRTITPGSPPPAVRHRQQRDHATTS